MSEYHVPAMPRPQTRTRQTIPDSLKRLIVESVVSKGQSKAEVARKYTLSFSTVSTIIKKFEHEGQVSSSRRRGGPSRRQKLTDDNIKTMLDFIADHPAATILEIREHLIQKGGPHVSVTTAQRAIKDRCHCSLKRLHIDHDRHQGEQTIAARQRWIEGLETLQLRGFSLNDAVFFDEAGFNLHLTRSVGRSPIGERAIQQGRPADRKANMSLIVAVGREGLIGAHTHVGGFTSQLLIDFLEAEVLPGLRAGPPRVFIMDNARAHHSPTVVTTIQSAGHEIYYLPPYTPWFNISERVFAKVKPIVSRQDLKTHDTLEAVIYDTLSFLTAEDCQGWLREMQRWITVAKHGHALGEDHDAQDALARHGLLPNQQAVEEFNGTVAASDSSLTEDDDE